MLSCLMISAGCSTRGTLEIDSALTAPCPDPVDRELVTCRDAAEAAVERQQSLEACDDRMSAIRDLAE